MISTDKINNLATEHSFMISKKKTSLKNRSRELLQLHKKHLQNPMTNIILNNERLNAYP